MQTVYPCVPIQITSPRAAWYGKWAVNWDVESVKRAGGPWDSAADAVAAVLATGRYRLRPGTTDHLDRICD